MHTQIRNLLIDTLYKQHEMCTDAFYYNITFLYKVFDCEIFNL